MTVAEIFKSVNLAPCGPVPWQTKISERNAGVYVVALVNDPILAGQWHADYLPPPELERWLPNEPIVYIGMTRCRKGLAKRILDFYRHKYGNRSPHRGGQAVKLLNCALWVYWSPLLDALGCERRMLAAFEERAGRQPFANRLRSHKRKKVRTPKTRASSAGN